jgi:hypothetical protein
MAGKGWLGHPFEKKFFMDYVCLFRKSLNKCKTLFIKKIKN